MDPTYTREMDPAYRREQGFFTTVKIEALHPPTGRMSSGTGFLFWHPLPGYPDKMIVALVTCRHVLFDGEGLIRFKLHGHNPASPGQPNLEQPVHIGPALYDDAYLAHDDPEVDVALLNVSSQMEQPHFSVLFSAAEFADFSAEQLRSGSEVFFLGYPTGFSDERHNLPILRSGTIASIPTVDFNGKPEFLIDAQVYPGSSGSPVLVRIENQLRLVGMVGRSVTRIAPVECFNVAVQPGIRDFIGLGVVYKPAAILNVAEKAAQKTVDMLLPLGAR